MLTTLLQNWEKKTFSSLGFNEKLLTVQNGRPCPSLLNSTVQVCDKNKSYVRQFTTSNYNNYNWLCKRESLTKLFCWPCCLISRDKNIWVNSGFSNLSGISKSAKAHDKSESQLQSVFDLYNFRKQRVDEGISNTFKVNNLIYNRKV